MRLVELADEFGLTTSDAIDLCGKAGVPAQSAGDELTDAEAERWRAVATHHHALDEIPDDIAIVPDDPGFGPLPLAPWDPGATDADRGLARPPAAATPMVTLAAGWGADAAGHDQQVSLYAATSLALAVVSLIFPFVPAALAIPISWYAKREIAQSQGRLTGERLAMAAQVVSAIGVALWLGIFAVTWWGSA
jgi:hypothetical protein